MLDGAHVAYPDRQLDSGIGYAKVEGGDTFTWEGVVWTPQLVTQRVIWIGIAVVIVGVATVVFDRFDPARASVRLRSKRGLLSLAHKGPAGYLPRLTYTASEET